MLGKACFATRTRDRAGTPGLGGEPHPHCRHRRHQAPHWDRSPLHRTGSVSMLSSLSGHAFTKSWKCDQCQNGNPKLKKARNMTFALRLANVEKYSHVMTAFKFQTNIIQTVSFNSRNKSQTLERTFPSGDNFPSELLLAIATFLYK